MLKNIRSYFMKLKGFQRPLERYFFPVVLLLYPFFGITAGLDIADTTYNLGNFEYMSNVDPMWLFSTYFSNLIGSLIMKLPGAGTMIGFAVYCTFFISAMALVSYYVLQNWLPGWMIFIGEFIAESLCWAPRVILYQYIPYFLLTIGSILLILGIFSWKKQNILLFAAGVCLGLNVLARFPAIVDCMLILVLWFYSFINKDKFIDAARKTGVCIAGYVAGLGLPLILISIKYGFNAYPEAIIKLLSMTEGASDYSSGGMLELIIEAYLHTFKNMIIMIPCLAAGIIMFLMAKGRFVLLKKLAFIAGLLVLARYYYGQGVLTANYFYYDCMFQVAMMFLIISAVLCIIGAHGILNGTVEERTLSAMALVQILILPLGSNNRTMPVLNCLFLIAPISLWLMRRLMQRLGDGEWNFAWQAMITGVIIATLFQGALFHINFSFVDGMDGTPRDTKVTEIPKAKGLVTTADNYSTLKELKASLEDNNLTSGKVLTFGEIPGIPYVFDMSPAINTTWPDLDSYSVDSFDDALSSLDASKEPAPTVIIGYKENDGYANFSVKYDKLMDYIGKHDYNKIFESDRFTVYAANDQ
ncbi:hypothetical protein SAMN02910342_01348 [Butyrivibrio sp. INlla21]|nr:hypothetical protein SAMN02910342_01348 [Butyrivibrio sp. INlla21]